MLTKFVGKSFPFGKGGQLVVKSIDDAGQVVVTQFAKRGGKLVEAGTVKMSGAQFASRYSTQVFKISGKDPQLLKFLKYTKTFYPAKRAAADILRMLAAASNAGGPETPEEMAAAAAAGATGLGGPSGPRTQTDVHDGDELTLAEHITELQNLYGIR